MVISLDGPKAFLEVFDQKNGICIVYSSSHAHFSPLVLNLEQFFHIFNHLINLIIGVVGPAWKKKKEEDAPGHMLRWFKNVFGGF